MTANLPPLPVEPAEAPTDIGPDDLMILSGAGEPMWKLGRDSEWHPWPPPPALTPEVER